MKKITLINFYKAVAAAGTPVPLMIVTNAARKVTGPASILVTARKNTTTANTGDIYFGNRNSRSEVLEPGDRIVVDVERDEEIDLSEVFIDAATNADAVAVTVKQS